MWVEVFVCCGEVILVGVYKFGGGLVGAVGVDPVHLRGCFWIPAKWKRPFPGRRGAGEISIRSIRSRCR